MSSDLLLALVAIGCFLLAVILGWFLWGRPLGTTRMELADRREDFGRAIAEVAAFKQQAETAAPFAARAAELEVMLAAANAAQAERERATTAAAIERDRVHAAQLAQIRDEFQRLAGEALARASTQFTETAAETLKLHRAEAQKGLTESKVALADLVAPMKETLGRYGDELKAMETKREQAYGSLSEQLAAVAVGQASVKTEAGKIVAALRSSSKASGAWGEGQLKRVLELSGLGEGIDFELQASATDEAGRQKRPDAIIKLPGDRELIVDSKCSVEDHVAAVEATTEAERMQALLRHSARVRSHVRSLSAKAYWDEFGKAADFVVMFLPGENFLSAAMEHDPELHLWAMQQRVLLVGPVNLLAVARVVAMVWRQEKVADEARKIGELGASLYASLATMAEHLNRVGKNIGDAANAYNDFVGSLENNVLPKARRFPELGVDKGKKALPDIPRIEKVLRLVPPELKQIEGGG